jgi:protein-disulfide isomerase
MKKQILILVGLGILIIGGGIALMLKTGTGDTTEPVTQDLADPGKLVRDDSHMTGKKDAKVTIVEFGDYQCPACLAFHQQDNAIIEQFKNNPDFNFVFRHFPLPQHQHAGEAAQAAEAASEQGKFWEMHKLIYDHQNDWATAITATDMFVSYAQQLDLNVDQFKTAVQNKKFAQAIANDVQDANALNVNSTPTIYFNGEKLGGIPSAESFKQQIEEALKK